jgi:SAM-dependent methyltransferase
MVAAGSSHSLSKKIQSRLGLTGLFSGITHLRPWRMLGRMNPMVRELKAQGKAREKLTVWANGAQVLGLLRASLNSGIFDAAREPKTARQIAASTGMPIDRVLDTCEALYAHAVFEKQNAHYQLAQEWQRLVWPNAIQQLHDLLDIAIVTPRVLESAIVGEFDYWSLASADQVTMAKNLSVDPTSEMIPNLFIDYLSFLPDIKTVFEQGGHFLEIGCGVGGLLLSLVRTYPNLTAVGVEIAPDIIAEAQRLADELGISDRVELRHCDAQTLLDTAAFDAVFWAQPFFPANSRATVLQIIMRALKPGGFLYTPLLDGASTHATRTAGGRMYALARLLYGSWGIPVQNAHDVQSEVVAAGFEHVELKLTPFGRGLLARSSSA